MVNLASEKNFKLKFRFWVIVQSVGLFLGTHTDSGLIPGTHLVPEHCQEWTLSSESRISPEHHQLCLEAKMKTYLI